MSLCVLKEEEEEDKNIYHQPQPYAQLKFNDCVQRAQYERKNSSNREIFMINVLVMCRTQLPNVNKYEYYMNNYFGIRFIERRVHLCDLNFLLYFSIYQCNREKNYICRQPQ